MNVFPLESQFIPFCTSFSIQGKGNLSYHNQHLFSGLFKIHPPTASHADNWPFNGLPQCNTVCSLADCNQCVFPSVVQSIFIFCWENYSPHVSIRCFLLLWFAFIHVQHASKAAIVCWWNLPKGRNIDGEQKAFFFFLPKKREKKRRGQGGQTD